MRCIFLFLLLLLATITPLLHATATELPFEPGHLQTVSGVVVYRLGSDTWSPAERNYPVFQGMQLSTAPQAHARIDIGPNDLQMSSDTEVDVSTLAERLTDLIVRQGEIHLTLRRLDPGNSVELELAHGTLWVLHPGQYVIEAGDGKSEQRVRIVDGRARLVGGSADQEVGAGDVMVITTDDKISITRTDTAGGPSTPSAAAPPPPATSSPETLAVDAARTAPASGPDTGPGKAPDQVVPASGAAKKTMLTIATKTDSEVAGLDRYGHWRDTPNYGQAWFPSDVPADWAPYRFGHWASIPPWGWTWIDDQPWGFTPFHYGRWANVDGRWGWIPGNAAEPAVYAPALVSFVGDPGGIPVDGSTDPAVAWVPLGPDEPYWPWYDSDDAYAAGVNEADVVVFRGAPLGRIAEFRRAAWHAEFANRRFLTAVGRDRFVHAESVGSHMMHLDAARFAHVPAMAGAPHFAAVHPAAFTHAEAAAARIGPAAAGAHPQPTPGASGHPVGEAAVRPPAAVGPRAALPHAPRPMAFSHPYRGGMGAYSAYRGGMGTYSPYRGQTGAFSPYRGQLGAYSPYRGAVGSYSPYRAPMGAPLAARGFQMPMAARPMMGHPMMMGHPAATHFSGGGGGKHR